MIPVDLFILTFNCKRHGEVQHQVSFLAYNFLHHCVSFQALCCNCLEEAEIMGYEDVGFRSVMRASDWNQITPWECEPQPN